MPDPAHGPIAAPHGRTLRTLLIVLLVAAFVAVALVFGAGVVLTKPALRMVGPPPSDLAADTIRIPVPPSAHVAGWLARGQPGAGVVLLLHSSHADRRELLARARVLHAAGHGVLLIDQQAHGESPGEHITYGVREAQGVLAALGFLRAQFPGERVGVLGVSLGAASVVLARPRPAPDAVVLESLFPTLEEAVADRLVMRFGTVFGPPLAPLLLWQLPMLGVSAAQLRPIEAIAQLGAPVLVASGTHDLHTPWAETERLYAAAAEPKALWRVEGAAHQDLLAYDPQGYAATVFAFLDRHLRR